jgi:hypothetical protein
MYKQDNNQCVWSFCWLCPRSYTHTHAHRECQRAREIDAQEFGSDERRGALAPVSWLVLIKNGLNSEHGAYMHVGQATLGANLHIRPLHTIRCTPPILVLEDIFYCDTVFKTQL